MEQRNSAPDDSRCVIYADGGARGNPGPAAAGAVLLSPDGASLAEISEYLGETTNNVAEYRALVLALRRALEIGCRRVQIRLDSELVVKQLGGHYRVKDVKLQPLHGEVRRLLARFDETKVEHVPRGENKLADKLVNAALDAQAAARRLPR